MYFVCGLYCFSTFVTIARGGSILPLKVQKIPLAASNSSPILMATNVSSPDETLMAPLNSSSPETSPLPVVSSTPLPSSMNTSTTIQLPGNPGSNNETNNVIRGVPGNPTNVHSVAYDGQAQVSWDAPEDDGSDTILAYEVVTFKNDEKTPSSSGNVVISNTSPTSTSLSTSTIIGGLVNGESYSFKVRSKNTFGYSTWSARSDPVSPLHPPDLCTHHVCSGHGACFPNYDTQVDYNAKCVCYPAYTGAAADCSTKNDKKKAVWTVGDWDTCSVGCNGGFRKRQVQCAAINSRNVDTGNAVGTDKDGHDQPMEVVDHELCGEKKPVSSQMCNSMACGSNLIEVRYEIDMSFDEVIFDSESRSHFEDAFRTEVASSLEISTSRIDITSIYKGSIFVEFLILPPTTEDGQTLDEVVEKLQAGVKDNRSTLRTKGTFARRVQPDTLEFSFFIADQTTNGGAEDISVAGLIGTVLVLVAFISTFAWFLRRRYEAMEASLGKSPGHAKDDRGHASRAHRRHSVIKARPQDLEPMLIQTMA